jgi:hypothetical protein
MRIRGPPNSGKSCPARFLRSLFDRSTAYHTPIPYWPRPPHPCPLQLDPRLRPHFPPLPQLIDAIRHLSSSFVATICETAGPSPEPLQHTYSRPVLLTVPESWSCPASLAEHAPAARSQFSDGPIGTDDGLRRTI